MRILSGVFSKNIDRSNRSRVNSLFSLIFKGGSLLINFMLVPLILTLIDATQYGVWLTVSSLIAWSSFFDFGLSNGLRNKLTESLALNDIEASRRYISTMYALMIIIFGTLSLLFTFVYGYINWYKLFHISTETEDLPTLVILILLFFCFQFILKVVYTLCNSFQKPYYIGMIEFFIQLFSLIGVYFLINVHEGGLIKLSFVLCGIPLIVLLLFNVILFRVKFRKYTPQFNAVDIKLCKNLFAVSLRFFVIQIAGLIQYQSSSILISHYFSSDDVVVYNLSYKYFSIPNILFTIILTPFWSAVTDAYIKKDFRWIKSEVNVYLKMYSFLFVLALLMFFCSSFAYRFWLGEGEILIPLNVSFWSFVFSVTSMITALYVSAINGIGALKIQYMMCFVTPLLFIGLVYIMNSFFEIGLISVIIAGIISNISGFIIAPIQFYQIMNNKKGIWIKC
ncbi:MAG: oligosaccharide flippase family protein [Bacteroidales bacterium]